MSSSGTRIYFWFISRAEHGFPLACLQNHHLTSSPEHTAFTAGSTPALFVRSEAYTYEMNSQTSACPECMLQVATRTNMTAKCIDMSITQGFSQRLYCGVLQATCWAWRESGFGTFEHEHHTVYRGTRVVRIGSYWQASNTRAQMTKPFCPSQISTTCPKQNKVESAIITRQQVP